MRELTLSEIDLVAGGGQSSSWGDQWVDDIVVVGPDGGGGGCLLYTSPSPRDATLSRMPSSA